MADRLFTRWQLTERPCRSAKGNKIWDGRSFSSMWRGWSSCREYLQVFFRSALQLQDSGCYTATNTRYTSHTMTLERCVGKSIESSSTGMAKCCTWNRCKAIMTEHMAMPHQRSSRCSAYLSRSIHQTERRAISYRISCIWKCIIMAN